MFQAFLRYSGQSVTELIFIFPCRPGRRKDLMVPPILLEVGIESQCQPAGDRKQQTHTCRCQAKKDTDENSERHTEEHPGQTGLVMAFVNVTKSGHDAQSALRSHFPLAVTLRLAASILYSLQLTSFLSFTIPSVLNIRR